MPSLNFKKQFVPAILLGLAIRAQGREPYPDEQAKLQTIRVGKRKYKAGDRLPMFAGPRMAPDKIGEAVCREVISIHIDGRKREVRMPSGFTWRYLTDDDLADLARADGFSSTDDFFAFFADTSFVGQLIKW